MENPAKIIIIDDNADFCFTMETFLKRNGFEAFSAEDGKKGLDLIQKHRPDLILLDVMMETTYSGLDVCKKVRINPELKDIPIIGISGMGDKLGVHVHKWGDSEYFSVDEFYEKPVDRENLLERIKVRLKKGVVKKHKHFEG
ncbi:MAG: response regulator [Proteobacteria bacterium]|nr:response regulator [Pseudomonadota bacterium]MBU1903870.1 response regulator [Pseudomonadota bacterium]